MLLLFPSRQQVDKLGRFLMKIDLYIYLFATWLGIG